MSKTIQNLLTKNNIQFEVICNRRLIITTIQNMEIVIKKHNANDGHYKYYMSADGVKYYGTLHEIMELLRAII